MAESEEKRKSERRPLEDTIEYSLSVLDYKDLRRISANGIAVDISDGGLGFHTGYRLEPGHILMLRLQGENTPYAAVVRWARKEGAQFRIGSMLCK